MTTYRVYCLDGGSRIVSVELVEAAKDAQALASAKKIRNEFRRQVWDRDRLVGRIGSRSCQTSPMLTMG